MNQITINQKIVSTNDAQLHFMNWCLDVKNEGNPVPKTALACQAVFMCANTYRDAEAIKLVSQSGVEIN